MPADVDLAAFIRHQLGSVWALEILLLLRRPPRRAWSTPEAVSELRASTSLVDRILRRFVDNGLAAQDCDGRCRYAPASQLLDQVCEQVEDAYRRKPVATINLISAPPDRLQQLADAFRLKGPRP